MGEVGDLEELLQPILSLKVWRAIHSGKRASVENIKLSCNLQVVECSCLSLLFLWVAAYHVDSSFVWKR